ncbi:alpha/beta fold hydrolase [Corallincola platygyrae]|uniref:Alpha/beta fold hydrolase n=1 Tax=Corallincola platygyrae TaxID=1193278 RepID=A0ABW4XQQ5_9GAMM
MPKESQLNEQMMATIHDHLEQIVERGRFAGIDDVGLDWACYHPEQATKAILLVNGRIESHYKYIETIYDFVMRGYAVFTYDHRGQGASDRLAHNRHLGHVDKFDHYQQDLAQLCDHYLWPRGYQQVYLVAHSMGCCVSAQYLAEHRPPIERTVFCSPMFKIHSGHLPWHLAKWIVHAWSAGSRNLCQWFGGEPGYFLFGSGYKDKPFETNLLSHSAIRYQAFRELYQRNEDLQLGSPSAHWVEQAVLACQQVIKQASQIHIPILVIEAGADRVVDKQGVAAFAATALDCRHHTIEGARHELFLESDNYRQPTLDTLFEFID